MSMPTRILHTVDDVIEVLGGAVLVARLVGRSRTAPHGWRKAGFIPAAHYDVMITALAARRAVAPPSLWRQTARRPGGFYVRVDAA